jgi:hypothetical protein
MPRHRAKESNALIIDRAAAAERPSVEAIGDWARDKRVFVSSVMSDLGPERQAVSEVIRKIGARSVMFEEFGGRMPILRTPTSAKSRPRTSTLESSVAGTANL